MRHPRDEMDGLARCHTSNLARRMSAPALTRIAVLACLCWPCVGGAGQPSSVRRAGPHSRGLYLHQPTLGLRGAGAGGQESDISKSDDAVALLEVMACAGCSRKFAGDAYTLGCGHTICEECHPATDSKGGIGEEGRHDEVEGCVLCGNSTGWIGAARDIVVGNAVRNLKGAAGHGNVSNLLRDELTCMLCSDLYFEPWTAPCGHSFCEPCVARSLDHSPKCPGCRRDIGGADADDAETGFLMLLRRRPNLLLKRLVATLFAPEADERLAAELERQAPVTDGDDWIPVFVCTLAFPGIRFPLHVFEPRYKLMMRRCIKEGGSFGMCSPEELETGMTFAGHGTLMGIREAGMMPDGRLQLDTCGLQVFKVLERGMRDGYHVARVQILNDKQAGEASKEEVGDIIQACKDRVRALKEWHDGGLWDAVVCAAGEEPSFGNLTALSWWMASVTHFLVGEDEGVGESLIKVLSEEDALTRLNMTLKLSPLPMRLTDDMGSMGEYDESSDQGSAARDERDDMEEEGVRNDEGDQVESGSGSEEEHGEAGDGEHGEAGDGEYRESDDGEYETSSDPVVMPIPLHGKKRERQMDDRDVEE